MAFCNMCGTPIPDNATTCTVCASRAASAPAPAPVPAGTSGLSDNVAGMLAYFTFVPALIFLVMEPYNRSRYVRFHSWQSLMFSAIWFVLWRVLRFIVHIPLFGWLTLLTWPIIILGGFIIWLFVVLKASQGQMFKLPAIGDIAEKQAGAV